MFDSILKEDAHSVISVRPIIRPLDTTLNAFEIMKVFCEEEEVIFLDSSRQHELWGQYSFIAFAPFMTLRYKNGVCHIDDQIYEVCPFNSLKKIMSQYKIENTSPFPFVGGGIGYFAYDLVRDMEKLPEFAEEIVDIPTCYFNFYHQAIIYDHFNEKAYISLIDLFGDLEKRYDCILDKLKDTKLIQQKQYSEKIDFHSPFSKDSYKFTVERMRQYIKDGDIYIANLTHTFTAKTAKKPIDIYGYLRTINPAPFSAYMQLEGFHILSSSPERFLKIRKGHVETRPIKGTRPRGKSTEEDERNRLELLNSEKDKAELLMIVDLMRNDLSKVCKPFSVKVDGLYDLEAYATVYHLVSTVRGELKENQTAIDCIRACFPGGSVTGTPKVRAMEIIEELEPTRRNLYTGCIGYIGFDGNADMNIVIRTIVQKEEQLYIGVGGGITWESVSEAEYQETLDKAIALFESVTQA